MENDQLQKLRGLPIEEVAERLGLEVRRHKSLCPFHQDRHPSLSFHVGKNTYRCFVCGAHGGPIDLVMQMQRMEFLDACRWLSGDARCIAEMKNENGKMKDEPIKFDASRYEKFFEHPRLSEAARTFLFQERRLDPRVVRWCRLTSWRDKQGNEWLQIPYYDPDGRLVGLQNRNLAKCAEPRFRFPKGSKCSIYNLPIVKLLKEGEPLYITEGCSDCWAMLSSGRKAIAVPSATLLNPADVELLSTLNSELSTQYHMYPDRDAPGESLFLQLQALLPNLEHHQLPLGCKDYSEAYLQLKVEN